MRPKSSVKARPFKFLGIKLCSVVCASFNTAVRAVIYTDDNLLDLAQSQEKSERIVQENFTKTDKVIELFLSVCWTKLLFKTASL